MIKKGIELQMISPSLLLKQSFMYKDFSVCSVCKTNSLFLCYKICKYRKATYAELHNFKKGGAE